MLQIKNDILHIENIPLPEIAEAAATPSYIYSAAHIRGQYETLSSAMRKALPAGRQPMICYACKANGNLAILHLLKNLGSCIESVSEGEMRRALKAGFLPEKIVSEGVGKTAAEIKLGLESGIHQFNLESLGELQLINDIAASLGKIAKVVFRLNPDVKGGGFEKIQTGEQNSKFGLSPDKVFQAYEQAKTLKHIEARGIFTHIGSQIWQNDAFENLFKKLASTTRDLRAAGHQVSCIDIGGGFPIRYRDENLLDIAAYAKAVNDLIVPLETEIILEPGRYLVGNAGIILSEVLYTKESYGQNFLILDAGMNTLLRPALYGAYHEISPVRNLNAPAKIYDIAGPICESSDFFARSREIPEMVAGDLAVIKSAGAYGFCMASNYNTQPLPAEILVDGDRFEIIRPRQNYEEILDRDRIPDWLNG